MIYLKMFIALHMMVFLLLLFGVLLNYKRYRRFKNHAVDSTWIHTIGRKEHLFKLSLTNLLIVTLAELVNFWLLWMAGLFN